jgi:hypothetical protein
MYLYYYKMKAPQNLQIPGMTSKIFYVQFIHKIKTENFQIFIESILSDLMDAIGETFKANVSLFKNKGVWNTYEKSIISLEFPEYHWLSEVGMKISEFIKKYDEMMFYVTVGLSGYDRSSSFHEYVMFELVAKDGVYIEKKMKSIDMTFRTIDDNSWCHGQKVPFYNTTTTEF